MSESIFVACVGAVLSADIAVPDHEREVTFYSRVLTTGGERFWRADLMNNLGIPVIGLGERIPEYEDLPLQWMPHIQVADVATSVQRTEELGGKVLMHHRDEQGTSQWAVLEDPNGAAFGVIPVVPAEAIPPMEAEGSGDEAPPVGRIAWLDLTVENAEATRDFYRDVVGWAVEEVEMSDAGSRYADYNMLNAEGRPAAGICHARGVNTGLPPVWLLYLPVGDIETSLRRVEQEGGKVVKEMRGDNGVPSFAVVQDPAGVSFALVAG